MEAKTKTKAILAKTLSFDELGFIYPDIDPNDPQMDQVCQFFNVGDREFTNGKAYGRELVKRYNMHNEALDIILEFVRESKSNTPLVKKAVELLNKDKV